MRAPERSDAYTASGMSILGDRRGAPAPPAPPDVDLSDDDFVPPGLTAWAGRTDNGFHVQGLVAGDGTTFISCALNGAYQTFEVARADAAEAFIHPFAYGCTLPL